MEYKDPGRYIPIIYLLYSWGSQFGVPSRVPLEMGSWRIPGPHLFYASLGLGLRRLQVSSLNGINVTQHNTLYWGYIGVI